MKKIIFFILATIIVVAMPITGWAKIIQIGNPPGLVVPPPQSSAAVPEPATILLAGAGFSALVARYQRGKKNKGGSGGAS